MKILYFDTETTGFNPPAIVQLWYIFEKLWSWKEEWNHLFNPWIAIVPQASEVHWLYAKDLVGKPEFKTILKKFVEITKEADYICWHNIQFDFRALFYEIDKLHWEWKSKEKIDKWKTEMQCKSICTMQLSINLCKLPWRFPWKFPWKYKWPKLNELHNHLFQKDFENAHDAMWDIIATRHCFLKMKELWVIKL